MEADQFSEEIERPGEPQIITVEKGEIISGGVLRAQISRRPWPGVLLMQAPDPRTQRLQFFPRSVGGPVVHDDDLVVGERLRPDGPEGLLQQCMSVTGGNDDGEQRHVTCHICRWFRWGRRSAQGFQLTILKRCEQGTLSPFLFEKVVS